jgi:glycogen(starch) synthase
MNVCFFSREYPPETHAGGIGTYTHNTAVALSGLGHEVHVIASTRGSGGTSCVDGVWLHRLGTSGDAPRGLDRLRYSRSVARAAGKIGVRFDIVQASEFGAEAFWFSLRKRAPLVTRLATPLFLTERLNAAAQSAGRILVNRMERAQTRRSDGVLASTRALAGVAAAEWKIPPSRIEVIPNSVDVGRIVRLAESRPLPQILRNKPYLLYFGRLEERKGIRVLADALPSFMEKDAEIWVVFAGSDSGYQGTPFREIIEDAAGLRARNRLVFFDNLPQEELFPIVAAARIVVLPSLWEAFGFVCVEALALGRPVIATSGSGFEEIIDDGDSGYLVAPGDSGRLAAKILACLRDDTELSRISAGAKKRAADFAVTRIVPRLLQFYERVREERPAQGRGSRRTESVRPRSPEGKMGREIFRTGGYVPYFRPDDKRNPFFRIYQRKRQDVAHMIDETRGPGEILDIGGGPGRLFQSVSDDSGGRLVVADVSLEMCALARKKPDRPDRVRVVNADARSLPFRDGSFEMIVGLDLFCHLEDPGKALREFARVLREDGVLVLDSSNSVPFWALFYPRYLGRNPLNWLRILRHKGVYPGWEGIVSHYPKKTFFSFLECAGFTVEKSLDYGPRVCPKWHLAVAGKKRAGV